METFEETMETFEETIETFEDAVETFEDAFETFEDAVETFEESSETIGEDEQAFVEVEEAVVEVEEAQAYRLVPVNGDLKMDASEQEPLKENGAQAATGNICVHAQKEEPIKIKTLFGLHQRVGCFHSGREPIALKVTLTILYQTLIHA